MFNCFKKELSVSKISNTPKEAPTIAGANVFENKYGRDFCLRISIISLGPLVKPPEAPPNALPNVPVITSTSSITLSSS